MPVGEQCPGSAHDGHLAGRAAKERRRAATRNGGGRVRMPAKNKCAPFVDMRKRGRRLAVRPSKNPMGEAWRAEALQMKSEPGDMRGGFGSLAQQGFPARFPGRAPGAGETCPGDKGPRSRPLSTSERPSTTRCRRSDCCARRAQLAFLCGYGVCQMPHTNQIYT